MTRAVGESEDVPAVLCALGAAAITGGDHAAARAYFRESRALSHERGNIWHSANALLGEGHVALAEDDAGVANGCYVEALQLFAGLPSWDDRRRRTGMAACLAGMAGAAASTAPERAARLFGSSAALRATVEPATLDQFDMIYPLMGNRAANDLALVTVRAALGDAVFDAAWAAGQALTLEQAVEEALAGSPIGNDDPRA